MNVSLYTFSLSQTIRQQTAIRHNSFYSRLHPNISKGLTKLLLRSKHLCFAPTVPQYLHRVPNVKVMCERRAETIMPASLAETMNQSVSAFGKRTLSGRKITSPPACSSAAGKYNVETLHLRVVGEFLASS